jgi:Acetyltransferase (GNAT) family
MIRRIRSQDKQRVLEISSQIWEGDDYISMVFDEWIEDDGVFAGLWENDILVGFGKLTFLTPTDIWLEGLRKDENTGAKKVGEKLSNYYMDFLKGKEINSIRFSTYFGNIASIKLNEKIGFEKILELSLKSKIIDAKPKDISNKLTTDIDFQTFKKYVEKSNYLNASKSFIYLGWVVHKYSEKLLKEYYENGNYIVWQENNEIKGCALWSDVHYRDVFWVSFLEVANEIIFTEFLNYFYYLTGKFNKSKIEILIPDHQLLEYCNNHGFVSWDQENDFYLYELPKQIITDITNK